MYGKQHSIFSIIVVERSTWLSHRAHNMCVSKVDFWCRITCHDQNYFCKLFLTGYLDRFRAVFSAFCVDS